MNTSELFPAPPQREEQPRKYSRPKTTIHLSGSPAPQPATKKIVDLGAEGDFEKHGGDDDLHTFKTDAWDVDEGVLADELSLLDDICGSAEQSVAPSDESNILGNDHGEVMAIPTSADEHASCEVVGEIVRETLDWIKKSEKTGTDATTNNTLPGVCPVDENEATSLN